MVEREKVLWLECLQIIPRMASNITGVFLCGNDKKRFRTSFGMGRLMTPLEATNRIKAW